MRLFRSIEYYPLVVDRLRSYYLVVQVDFCVLRIMEDNSYMQEEKIQSWVDLVSANEDTNDLFFDDFLVETHVEQVAEQSTPP